MMKAEFKKTGKSLVSRILDKVLDHTSLQLAGLFTVVPIVGGVTAEIAHRIFQFKVPLNSLDGMPPMYRIVGYTAALLAVGTGMTILDTRSREREVEQKQEKKAEAAKQAHLAARRERAARKRASSVASQALTSSAPPVPTRPQSPEAMASIKGLRP